MESTFTLYPGWATDQIPANRTAKQIDEAKKGGEAWARDIGKKFVLDELGRHGKSPYNFRGLFNQAFGKTAYVLRNRPFMPRRVSTDTSGQRMGPILETQKDDNSWETIKSSTYKLSSEEAGILVGEDDKNEDAWIQMLSFNGAGTDWAARNVRITAALESDWGVRYGLVTGIAFDAPVAVDSLCALEPTAGSFPVPTRALYFDSDIQWNYVSGVYALRGGVSGIGVARKDLPDLRTAIRNKAPKLKQRTEADSFVIPYINLGYAVGDYINEIAGRDISIFANVITIRFDCIQMTTELVTDDSRMSEAT